MAFPSQQDMYAAIAKAPPLLGHRRLAFAQRRIIDSQGLIARRHSATPNIRHGCRSLIPWPTRKCATASFYTAGATTFSEQVFQRNIFRCRVRHESL